MDGIDSFPHQNLAEGPNGDEPACPSVQPEASVEHLRNAKADRVHDGLGRSRPNRRSSRANVLRSSRDCGPRNLGELSASLTNQPVSILGTSFYTASVDCGVERPLSVSLP